MQTLLSHLECSACGATLPAERPQTVCQDCGRPLLARYDLDREGLPSLAEVLSRPPGQWRLAELAPVEPGTPGLGEGATPLVEVPGLAAEFGVAALWIKDEAQNPTGSFKARGMAAAVARAAALGIRAVALPSAGNAAAAASAYGALHGLEVHLAIPEATPAPIARECEALGAHLTHVAGTIVDAGRWITAAAGRHGWFLLSTLREPYRIEGKKVMGQELLYDLGALPDVILYPTGGGTGLVGMWKSFQEMAALGWLDGRRPRMVSVQGEGCAPIVRAFHAGAAEAEPWQDPAPTAAYGLRVPAAIGDRLMLQALRESDGSAVAVAETEIAASGVELARRAGLWPCPEGAACLAAARRLAASGWFHPEDRVVLFNTGSPLQYLG